MGIISTIGKIVFFPITAPLAAKKETAKQILKHKAKVKAVINTSFPENYQEFYEDDGYKTDILNGYVVVWEKGLSEDEIKSIKDAIAANKLEEITE